ncbi:MAG: hypothetical protein H7Y17_04290 [Chlorobia bacterium]|nr:hypothetical protein [Fimbriimonadaceae bacterium]
MASADLRRLWKLHQIDVAIQGIRNRATHLDVGKKTAAEIESLTNQLATNPYKLFHAEQLDLELQQSSLDDKVRKFESELYSGKIVNPREVDGYQKELAILKKQKGDIDEKLLEIWEQMPPLKELADKLDATLAAKKKELVETQRKAQQVKAELEADFKKRSAERPILAKEQNPGLLAKYEAIRKTHDGIGMAEVVKKRQCGACGTLLPERTLQGCLDDRTMTCETCHRILYYTEGVV